jgi:penicillin-insensitive murein endopeptidase
MTSFVGPGGILLTDQSLKEGSMPDIRVQDSRGFFILPQAPEEAAYYTYGTPGHGQSQYAHPALMTLIFQIEHRWSAIDDRKFGVGNISLANGVIHPDHATHRSGLEVDIRPLRKDGKQLPCSRLDNQYDVEATKSLVQLFWESGLVRRVLFNDVSIPRVTYARGHDNHFHVDMIL